MELFGRDLLIKMEYGHKELLITNNCIDNLPETREELLLKFQEILKTFKAFRCVAYKPTKTVHIIVEMYQETNENEGEVCFEKNQYMADREINWERINENFNLVADYVLEKKRILNYLRENRTQEEIIKEIIKIEKIRGLDAKDYVVELPEELNIFKGLSKEKIELRIKTIIMMKYLKFNDNMQEILNKYKLIKIKYNRAFEEYLEIGLNNEGLTKFSSEGHGYEDYTWYYEYSYEDIKKSVDKMVYFIEKELNEVKEQEKISIKSSDSEGVVKELKEILKLNLPISINEAYEYESQSNNGFIQLSKEDNKIYIVENKNPYWDLYTLKEDGEVLELEKLKEYLYEIAGLTIGNDKKVQDTLDWLND